MDHSAKVAITSAGRSPPISIPQLMILHRLFPQQTE
jgi:hypothetical protein